MKVSSSRKVGLGVFLIVASFISSVVAANININTDGRVEFGQGLYQVGACDSLVDISAESNGTNITEVIIDGLDITSCPNTYLRIKIYGSGTTPLNLYEESTTAVNRLLLYINGQSGRLNGIDFLNSRGLVPNPYEECTEPLNITCKSDTYLDFDYFEGRYRAIFNFPMASSGSFSSFTIETSGEPFTEINSCDVSPTITKVAAGSLMESVYIDNLDVPNCEDKYIRIRFYDSNSNLLNIYNENGVLVNRIQFYVNGQSDFLDGLDFLNSQGLIPNPYQDCSGGLNSTCKSDGFMSLDYFNGRYTVTFETPTAVFNDVARNEVDVADELQ
jgi:hypothetical protein